MGRRTLRRSRTDRGTLKEVLDRSMDSLGGNLLEVWEGSVDLTGRL